MTWFDLNDYWISIPENILSRNMYIWDILTSRLDLTPIGRIWPEFELWLTSKNVKSEFLRNVLVETYIGYISTNSPDLTLIRR